MKEYVGRGPTVPNSTDLNFIRFRIIRLSHNRDCKLRDVLKFIDVHGQSTTVANRKIAFDATLVISHMFDEVLETGLTDWNIHLS